MRESASSAARLESLVSPYTGLIHAFREVLVDPADARSVRFDCELRQADLAVADRIVPANGSGYDREHGLSAALGEAVERYSGTCLPAESDTVLATAEELGAEAVSPERFALFRDDQFADPDFEFEPFRSNTRIRWVRGSSIPDGEQVYLPLQLAYLWGDRSRLATGEAAIAPSSSNGMAAGATEDDAVLGGLLELIERDAVMIAWTNRLSLPLLDWSSDHELCAHFEAHLGITGLPCEVIDFSAFFGIPTALALMRAGSAGFGIGAASAPTMRQAWDKALRECFDTRTMVERELIARPDRRFRTDFMDIEEFEDHTIFYAPPEKQGETAFLTRSDERRAIAEVPALEGDDPAARIEAVARRLDAKDAHAYFVDISPVDVKEAGLHAVHVICPELQPLDYSYRHRFLGGKRLYQASYEIGLRDRELSAEELNPMPHPFP